MVNNTINNLQGKSIVLGVTGGIAAYKSADLTRRLMEAGADVQIVMTAAATEFVTPLTFHALSGHPVYVDGQEDEDTSSTSSAMQHIELARWADAIIIAPASANTIAKLAQGRADNLLTTLCLASEAIKCFAPAMNRIMWDDLGTQANCRNLTTKGWQQLGPDSGLQACGETGEGRMRDVSDLIADLSQCFSSGELHGLNVMVTAGPTFEAIDPVRFIGNRSSGRMGYAIATAAREAGANVTLISGPVALKPPETKQLITVESADEMQQAVLDNLKRCDIYISAAAISDYRAQDIAEQKIKKSDDSMTLQLVRNEDILSLVANHKNRPYTVGFAAETQAIDENAEHKLHKKNLDMIVANDVGSNSEPEQPDIGFNSEYNALQVLWKQDSQSEVIEHQNFEIARKSQLARQLISLIAKTYRHKRLQDAQDSA
jgi:phosphopantothenoylcysteine decarboxylase/phosphopantothenate--cysteine ligase